ncbi:uncharacterized protein Aud_009748 [Aspergillus udagawae]|uniref:Uncharacterized protein n=1 Tax=Aspergillus udagawae TaxID=91492 RepID=A0A8E0V426_9EURO|nr:uncharacterized protein Aud_009748 [Aspergillus udagawae]GIC93266.1 hypothetical protein Aud_009748 [Aspergillus udagawae]
MQHNVDDPQPPTNVTYKQANGRRITTDIYLPPSTSSNGKGETKYHPVRHDVPHPPRAILAAYAAVHSEDPCLATTTPLPHVREKYSLPALDKAFLNKFYKEKPVPTSSGVNLLGQSETRLSRGQVRTSTFSRPQDALALTQIANGRVLRRVTVIRVMSMGGTSRRLVRWRTLERGSSRR